MAFRKRNAAVGRPSITDQPSSEAAVSIAAGVKSSVLTTQPITSTGTASLDSLLGGHGGLILGSSLLIEEAGTTDFAGALLRRYAAQGICHGHVVHVVAVGEGWVRELPGLVEEGASKSKDSGPGSDPMKIAWRYERLSSTDGRATFDLLWHTNASSDHAISSQARPSSMEAPFCHTFDLSKRLVIHQSARINHIRIAPTGNPFDPIIKALRSSLATSSLGTVHRLIMPSILSPVYYPSQASRPEHFIRFTHALRALLRSHPTTLTAMIILPLELYPRNLGLVRWAEILCDGVLELSPFPHLMDASNSLAESGGARSTDEQPQGMVKVHKLPVNTERGEGGAGAGNSIGDDLAFTVSRRNFVIKPFSLPPVVGDQEAQAESGKLTKKEVDF